MYFQDTPNETFAGTIQNTLEVIPVSSSHPWETAFLSLQVTNKMTEGLPPEYMTRQSSLSAKVSVL